MTHAQTNRGRLRVSVLAALRDNYVYVLWDEQQREAIVVDPGEAAPVISFLRTQSLALRGIVATHHHHDHVGGIAELCAFAGSVAVYASRYDMDRGRIPAQSVALEDSEAINLLGRPYVAMAVPGHTLGALAYYGEQRLFTGDTLFLAGCGRMFEGTAPMMHASLARLAALPPDTELHVGHEYTANNLRFASHVEPHNEVIKQRVEQHAESGASQPTLALELQSNPFLRCDEPEVISYACAHHRTVETTSDVFAALRAAKDAF